MKLNKDIIIAIDGHASCGKSTLAKLLAQTLNYTYIDTGAMYRAITLYAIEKKIINNNKLNANKLISELYNIKIEFLYNPQTDRTETFLNEQNIEKKIRGYEVSQWTSHIAKIPEVRKFLVTLQQELGKNKRIVMDGRDIGTIVFPQAELKLFLTAKVEERAKRRYKELIEKGEKVNYEQILNNLIERDHIDSTRSVSPLTPATDAIIIDNTNLNIKEQFSLVIALLSTRFGQGIECLLR